MIYRVEVLSLLSDKKQDCFHVEMCTVEARWKIVTAVTKERLCGETT